MILLKDNVFVNLGLHDQEMSWLIQNGEQAVSWATFLAAYFNKNINSNATNDISLERGDTVDDFRVWLIVESISLYLLWGVWSCLDTVLPFYAPPA